jgi:hypothetical protein
LPVADDSRYTQVRAIEGVLDGNQILNGRGVID